LHGSLYGIEKESFKKSLIHDMDPRVKLLSIFLIILAATLSNNVYSMILIELYLILLMMVSRLSLSYALKRILLILPFGGFISLFQPFVHGETVVFQIFGLPVYQEGLSFGLILFSKFLVSVTSVVFLSLTTPMHEVISAGRKLGLPNIMSTLLGLMVRYLFIMYDVLESTLRAQKARCLNRKNLTYIQMLNIFGYSVGALFLRAYEQGERTYLGMISRGYSENSKIGLYERNIGFKEIGFLIFTIIFLIAGLVLFN
jgi:cobalt/nickel transport system permease protein